MSKTINVSHIPSSVTKDQISEFFSLSGKIDTVDYPVDITTDATANDTHTAKVTFVSLEAVSSALLLDGAILGGSAISIVQSDSTTTATSTGEVGDAGDQGDAPQEIKPKAAILAEYLSKGYVLSEQALEKGIEFDNKNGISIKFKAFLNSINDKYKIEENLKQVDEKYKIQTNVKTKFNYFANYFENLIESNQTGLKIKKFYSDVVYDAALIHEEAKRLAEIEIEKSKNINVTPSISNTADANITKEEKN